MSSQTVRDLIKNYMAVEFPSESLIDLTEQYDYLEDMLRDNNVSMSDPWVGIQFLGGDEIPVDISANNTQGCYRESGTIWIHVVEMARLGPKTTLIPRADSIRSKFRGKRLGDMVIRSVSPPATGAGATLNFEGGYIAALIQITYDYDITASP